MSSNDNKLGINTIREDIATPDDPDRFMRLRDRAPEFALIGCLVNGERTHAIVEGSHEFDPDWPWPTLSAPPGDDQMHFKIVYIRPTKGLHIEFSKRRT
jgi:hypothetical protein